MITRMIKPLAALPACFMAWPAAAQETRPNIGLVLGPGRPVSTGTPLKSEKETGEADGRETGLAGGLEGGADGRLARPCRRRTKGSLRRPRREVKAARRQCEHINSARNRGCDLAADTTVVQA